MTRLLSGTSYCLFLARVVTSMVDQWLYSCDMGFNIAREAQQPLATAPRGC